MKAIALLVAVTLVGLNPVARADDKKADAAEPRGKNKQVKIAEVPEKFVKAAKEAMPGVEWTHAEINTDLGTHESLVVYEITGTKDGKEVEVDVRADGSIEEMEEVIDAKDVPKAVAELLAGEFAGFKAIKIEKSTRPYRGGAKVVWYEFKGTTKDGAPLDVEITEDGKYFVVEAD